MAEPDYKRLTAMHFHAWKSGLKTGTSHHPLYADIPSRISTHCACSYLYSRFPMSVCFTALHPPLTPAPFSLSGMYYLRTKPAANAIQFTVDRSTLQASRAAGEGPEGPPGNSTINADVTCTDEVCISCQG